jgi:hypothetical protein
MEHPQVNQKELYHEQISDELAKLAVLITPREFVSVAVTMYNKKIKAPLPEMEISESDNNVFDVLQLLMEVFRDNNVGCAVTLDQIEHSLDAIKMFAHREARKYLDKCYRDCTAFLYLNNEEITTPEVIHSAETLLFALAASEEIFHLINFFTHLDSDMLEINRVVG